MDDNIVISQSSRRPRCTEAAVDQAVSRALKDHFRFYNAEDLMDNSVEGQSVFRYVRHHFVIMRAQNKNLTAAWWTELHEKVDGQKDWEPLVPVDSSAEPDCSP